ncbi:uncharacterized protein SCHCODRAFT_02520673 [Schizophyllum commune H4-8]|nr:uncharacterized protein SCHCODRAFT_02520673 [Schizophyllum commune H4-8]KAI5885410.1 hypothetical protein SCHCODRAFT_02520673 [Schizophyllum commune H4-8]
MMKLAILASAALFVAVNAAPAADNAQYITTTTQTDSACVYYTSGTETQTTTVAGSTSTLDDPSTTTYTTTHFVLPTMTARALDKREQTTIVVSQVCANTRTENPWTTTSDPAIVTTTTAYASTATYTETYTLCVEGHYCL